MGLNGRVILVHLRCITRLILTLFSHGKKFSDSKSDNFPSIKSTTKTSSGESLQRIHFTGIFLIFPLGRREQDGSAVPLHGVARPRGPALRHVPPRLPPQGPQLRRPDGRAHYYTLQVSHTTITHCRLVTPPSPTAGQSHQPHPLQVSHMTLTHCRSVSTLITHCRSFSAHSPTAWQSHHNHLLQISHATHTYCRPVMSLRSPTDSVCVRARVCVCEGTKDKFFSCPVLI